MRRLQFSFIFTGCLILCGCLTSPNAFYSAEDVFQDDRIVGDYTGEKSEEGSIIRKDPERKGRYIFRYFDKAKTQRWIEFTATLFKAGTNSYVDLFPYDDSFKDHIAGAPPSGMDIVRSVTQQPLHTVLRIAITDAGVAVALPQKRAVSDLIARHPTFTNQVRDDAVLVLQQSSKELHDLLAREGDALFPKPTDFKKPKSIEAIGRTR